MVICCVPKCGNDSWKCDASITFHDFPSNPDLAAKWIKQINIALRPRPMWFPRGRPVICSKHFLQTDFKSKTDALRPRCVPTIFGHKYIGENPQPTDFHSFNGPKTSPLIVKVNKPQESIFQNSSLQISEVYSQAQLPITCNEENNCDFQETNNFEIAPQTSSSNNNCLLNGSLYFSSKTSQCEQSDTHDILKSVPKESINQSNSVQKNNIRKKEKANNDLIEIGPNTFLKINPDIIKVNKKLTPSGNTVLQFLMDQKHANAQSSDILPKLIQGVSALEKSHTDCREVQSAKNLQTGVNDKDSRSDNIQVKDKVVHHVLGHLVDTHVCKESCAELKLPEEENTVENSMGNQNVNSHVPIDENSEIQNKTSSSNKANNTNSTNAILHKAPVLLTTNMPISHCFLDKSKYLVQLKQKNRQIASLKFKISNLNKKIEELEDRCIVQERQLSYSFIKRLKTIRKNATKGDPAATYILEQIRSYTNNSKMRWSDSTLTQCGIWCRKAPYAYEYFKKAKLFNLPCLGTVKRFIKKHPELKFQKNSNNCNPNDNDDDSSSDIDFDESDNQNEDNMSEDENDEPVSCETVLTVPSEITNPSSSQTSQKCNNKLEVEKEENYKLKESDITPQANYQNELNIQNNVISDSKTNGNSKGVESNEIPLTVDNANLELQEIILPSGEVVQCYSSNISNGTEAGSQYFIIPNVNDQNSLGDHEYSVVQADSLPIILQNFEHSQLHLQQQEQFIFIANSTDQVECSETEVTTA